MIFGSSFDVCFSKKKENWRKLLMFIEHERATFQNTTVTSETHCPKVVSDTLYVVGSKWQVSQRVSE